MKLEEDDNMQKRLLDKEYLLLQLSAVRNIKVLRERGLIKDIKLKNGYTL